MKKIKGSNKFQRAAENASTGNKPKSKYSKKSGKGMYSSLKKGVQSL